MSKTINKKFFKHLTFEKMYDAFLRAKKNKSTREEIMEFEYNIEKNIISLLYELKTKRYTIGNYKTFVIYEPKERIIKSLPFRDRVVHQWYVYEFLIPNVVPRFIYDSYACIKGRGTHNAVKRLENFMLKAKIKYGDYYIIKMDIKKFFYNINTDILFNILKKYINDKELLNMSSKLIFEANEKLGIPIGNYTSQYFANIYLNELDQFVKHKLKIKYYLRFMDDFVLLVENKDIAKKIFNEIEIFLKDALKLEINKKSRYYPSAMGVDFCGYRVFHTHKLVRNRSKKQMRKRIKIWNILYKKKKLNMYKVEMSLNSWLAHIKHANSYNLYNSYINKIEFKIEK